METHSDAARYHNGQESVKGRNQETTNGQIAIYVQGGWHYWRYNSRTLHYEKLGTSQQFRKHGLRIFHA